MKRKHRQYLCGAQPALSGWCLLLYGHCAVDGLKQCLAVSIASMSPVWRRNTSPIIYELSAFACCAFKAAPLHAVVLHILHCATHCWLGIQQIALWRAACFCVETLVLPCCVGGLLAVQGVVRVELVCIVLQGGVCAVSQHQKTWGLGYEELVG